MTFTTMILFNSLSLQILAEPINIVWHGYNYCRTEHHSGHTVYPHGAARCDLFSSHSLRPTISASKQHVHVEHLLCHCMQCPFVATNVDITTVWVSTSSVPTTTRLAVRAPDPFGDGCPAQSGACRVPSMRFDRLSSKGILPNEELDVGVFHRPMDREWTPHHP